MGVKTYILELDLGSFIPASNAFELTAPINFSRMLAKLIILGFLAVGVYGDGVLELGDSNFLSELEKHENLLVMFYKPKCSSCEKLEPEYAEAAEILEGNEPPIILAKVDCSNAGKETCRKYEVNGYPSLKIFSKKDVVSDCGGYYGPRKAAAIAKYVQLRVGPASKELKSEDGRKAFLKTDEVSIIGYFEEDDSPLAASFQAVAKKLREKARFAHTSAKSLLDKEGLTNNIVLYRPKLLHNEFEASSLKYEGRASIADIYEFITKNYFGLVGVRTEDNAGEFKDPLVVTYYGVDSVKNPKGPNYWRNRVMKVAKDFPSISFAISNKDDFQDELNDFGIDPVEGEMPAVLTRNAKGEKFALQGNFSVETLEKFVKDLEAGKLEPFLKSEAIPEDNSGNVKVLVAKNFDEIVNQADADVLIMFYAPWDGWSKPLVPVFNELGDKFVDENVIIAKMNAFANDPLPQFEIGGFPTLYWVPKNDKDSPVKYMGDWKIDDFIKYIAKHSTAPLKSFDRKGNPTKAPSDRL